MNVPVCFVSYRQPEIGSGVDPATYMDMGLLHRMIGRADFRPADALDYSLMEGIPPHVTGAVVVVPAQHHHLPAEVARLNAELARLSWVVLVLAGDEHSLFPWRLLEHPNLVWWVMTPRPHIHADLDAFFIGEGYRYSTPDTLARWTTPTRRVLDWFFAGQITHPRRQAMAAALKAMRYRPDELHETAGFLQGVPHENYMQSLTQAKIAPCPSGPGTPDSFRLYEALEAGCVPLADATTPEGWTGYWEFVYGEVPFPVIEDWSTVGDVIERELADWPSNANRTAVWWAQQKRAMAYRLDDDVRRVMANG